MTTIDTPRQQALTPAQQSAQYMREQAIKHHYPIMPISLTNDHYRATGDMLPPWSLKQVIIDQAKQATHYARFYPIAFVFLNVGDVSPQVIDIDELRDLALSVPIILRGNNPANIADWKRYLNLEEGE